MPTPDAIDTTGLDVDSSTMQELLSVNREDWLREVASIREFYASFGDKLPKELANQLDALEREASRPIIE